MYYRRDVCIIVFVKDLVVLLMSNIIMLKYTLSLFLTLRNNPFKIVTFYNGTVDILAWIIGNLFK